MPDITSDFGENLDELEIIDFQSKFLNLIHNIPINIVKKIFFLIYKIKVFLLSDFNTNLDELEIIDYIKKQLNQTYSILFFEISKFINIL